MFSQKVKLTVFSDYCRYYTGDLELFFRFDRLVLGIGGQEHYILTPFSEVLHRPLPVNFSNNNIPILGLLSFINKHHVAWEYAGF